MCKVGSTTPRWKGFFVASSVMVAAVNAPPAWPQSAEFEPNATPSSPAESIRYEPNLKLGLEISDIRTAIESSSLLFSLNAEELDSTGALFERADTDLTRIRGVLNALGFFSAHLAITIDGKDLDDLAARDRLAAEPASHPLKVEIAVEPGPLFKIGEVTFDPAPESAVDPLSILSARTIQLEAGVPARSATIVASDARIVAALREAGYPLVTIVARNAVVDHATATLDISYRINAGTKASMGKIAVKGTEHIKASFVAGLAPFVTGDSYRSSALLEYTDELDRLQVFDSITIEEGKALDDQNRLPMTVAVHERLRRVVGVTASWSTFEGAALGAYWGHRNLFGEAEKLRIEAQTSRLFSNGADDYEYALSGLLTIPAFPTSHDDITVRLVAERDRPDAYARDALELRSGILRRFDKSLSAEANIEFSLAHESDSLGTRDRTSITLPTIVTYDTRNDPLEPVTGLRAQVELTPLINISGGGDVAAHLLGSFAAYGALDNNARTVVAGRFAIGGTLASTITELPTDMRFFAGGGESVRGYPYQHLSPRNATDQIIGGRSLVEGSIEVRHWAWQDIGFAAFVDIGGAYTSNYPDFDQTGAGVGLGVRYRTPVGPIRLDVAVPLDPRGTDASFAVYVALGQAF